jgi:hypothetical protein
MIQICELNLYCTRFYFLCFILPHRRALEIWLFCLIVRLLSSFVVLGCRAWNSLPHDVKRLPTHGRFVSALRGMYRSLDRSPWFVWFVCVFVGACALLCCAISGPGWLVTRTVTWLRFCRIGMVLCEVAEDLTQNISNDIKSFFCFWFFFKQFYFIFLRMNSFETILMKLNINEFILYQRGLAQN